MNPATSKKKPPRFAKLDGKPPPRPRGRHAKPRSDEPPAREIVSIPVNQRLGFRPVEFAALIGVSAPTVWRAIKRGDIPIVDQNGIKIVPRSYAIKAGYITD